MIISYICSAASIWLKSGGRRSWSNRFQSF